MSLSFSRSYPAQKEHLVNLYTDLNETQAPSSLIRFQTKTELFCSVLKKICVRTYRFRIVFARPHYNAVSFWKRFYTLSVHTQMNSTHAHFNISAREIGAILDSLLAPGRVYLDDVTVFQIASFSPSTLENSVFKKHRVQIAPLWRAFSNDSILGDRFRRCGVDDSRIRSKTAPFSFENGLVWTEPKSRHTLRDYSQGLVAGTCFGDQSPCVYSYFASKF